MHDAAAQVVLRRSTYTLVPLPHGSKQEYQLDFPDSCAVAAICQYTEHTFLVLCACGGKIALFSCSRHCKPTLRWRMDAHPVRHGLAANSCGTVWVTVNNAVIGLKNWTPKTRHGCAGAGALSVDGNGRVVAACGEEWSRDCILRNGTMRRYGALSDVECIQCLCDGTLIVSDYLNMFERQIKLVGNDSVLMILATARTHSPWTGVCVRVNGTGVVSLSDTTVRLERLSHQVAPGTRPFRFRPTAAWVKQWPGFRPTAIAALCAMGKRNIPAEVGFLILSFV